MNDSAVSSQDNAPAAANPSRADAVARNLVHRYLRGIRRGMLHVLENNIEFVFGVRDAGYPPAATIFVHHPAAYRYMAFGGSVGAGEAYMAGYWSSDDVTSVVRILAANHDVLQSVDGPWTTLKGLADRTVHWIRRNTVRRSRRNIEAHYDLGNDFYKLFLDETMTYSCGLFTHPEETLEEAAYNKYERMCRQLRLRETDRVLEIGCGWGGFALHAARRYGCQVTATTISAEQFSEATERVRVAGLGDRITILNKDYRALTGTYDKISSIEMLEAVGYEYYDDFFATCSGLLKPAGIFALQSIIIADRYYERAKRSVDFIKRYIFPGGCLPSVGAICRSTAGNTDLQVTDLHDMTDHYPETLRRWRSRFLANADRVRALGYSEEFIRMWNYYLALCEGAFMERHIGNVQMTFVKPS